MVDYVNRGTDERPLENIPVVGWLAVRLQNWLSYHSDSPPKVLRLPLPKNGHLAVTWPPFISIAIPRWGDRYITFRAGWRWDHNWPGYIADVIIKTNMRQPVEP